MYETVEYNEGFFQLNSGYTHGSGTRHPASSSSPFEHEKRCGTIEEVYPAVRATLRVDACRHSFRMKEVEKYDTGNCEVV